MNSKLKKNIISTVIFLLLLFLAYYFVFKDYSMTEFINNIKSCNKIYFVFAILCVCAFVFFEALFFKVIFKKLGYKISWYKSFGYVFTEIYFSAITPSSTGGQPIQMMEMSKDDIPYRVSSIVVFINTLFYKLALLVIILIGLAFYNSKIATFSTTFKVTAILGFITTLALVIFFILLVFSKKVVRAMLKFLVKISKIRKKSDQKEMTERYQTALDDYVEISKYIRTNRKTLFSTFTIIFMQRLSLLLVSYFIYKSFNVEGISLFYAITIQSLLTIATDFIPLPGGVIISEGLFMEVNKILGITAISSGITIVFRAISFYALVLVSLLYFLIFHFAKRNKAKKIKVM